VPNDPSPTPGQTASPIVFIVGIAIASAIVGAVAGYILRYLLHG
jgi:hypothetical protein